ncbi:hypothetical protein LEQ41_10540 [Streptococcus agalactiae]|nr:hypothetical protein [Streptococcus agalactiae]
MFLTFYFPLFSLDSNNKSTYYSWTSNFHNFHPQKKNSYKEVLITHI